MKEMVGGCCVCSDERGWTENPLVYCDGQGCNVAVHQACYGIVEVPKGPWYCRKCLSQERNARVKCELCPSKDGALKKTDSSGWAHVVCALYIPEVRFGNVSTMEPIILQLVPHDRYNKVCYICEEQGKESKASVGACMQCNKSGCKQYFHVTCAQAAGLLCEEAGNYMDNVKYCGYCYYHYQKLKKVSSIKTIPAFKPIPADNATPEPSPEKHSPSQSSESKERKTRSTERRAKFAPLVGESKLMKESPLSLPPPILSASEGGTGDNHSDSSTSTSTLSSTNGSNSTEEGKKNTKSSSNSSILSGKFTSTNFKESLTSLSISSTFSAEKGKKRKGDSFSEKNSPESAKGSPSEKSMVNSALTFSGMYENFINNDLSARTEKNQETKPVMELKRSCSFSDGNERKKSKHSRSKGKSSKSPSDHSVIVNNQIPIVRIKRNFPHDISSDSHSIDKSNQNCSSLSQMNIEKEHNYHWCVIEQPVREKIPPAKERIETIVRPPEESESNTLDAAMPTETNEERMFPLFPGGVTCVKTEVEDQQPLNFSENFMKPTGSSEEKSYAKPASEPVPPILPPVPQTLEELLERQWEQGSNFIMEQAQHFDIASLLNCLHQMQLENRRLEAHIKNLAARRDHLLSVNARLRLPFDSMLPYTGVMEPALNQYPAAETNGLVSTVGQLSNNSFLPYDASHVHSSNQDQNFLKNSMPVHSPVATVGSSSMVLTPSPIPSSSAGRPLPLLQEHRPAAAVYQSISPPFGSPGPSAPPNIISNNTNHLYQSYPPPPHEGSGREDR